MYELIYADNEIRNLLEKEYPHATFKDASDYTHENRFTIEINPEIERLLEDEIEENFYVFAMKNNFVLDCFMFQLNLNNPDPANTKPFVKKLNKWMNLAGIKKRVRKAKKNI